MTTTATETPANEMPASVPPQPPETGDGNTANLDQALKEIDELKAALKRVNNESASHRHKAKELDELKAQIEAEKLSETEKLQKRLSTIQSEHEEKTRAFQERMIQYEVQLKAAKMGIIDPDAAAKLLSWSAIDYDESGTPTNLDTLLKDLIKEKPYLVSATKSTIPTPNAGPTNPSRTTSQGQQELSWNKISQMTAAEYEARRPEIQAFMMQHPPRFGQRLA